MQETQRTRTRRPMGAATVAVSPRRPGPQAMRSRESDLVVLRRRSQQLEESVADLLRTRDELVRSNEQLTRFASQVSHDLLNPLTAVIVSTELLTHEPTIAGDPNLCRIAENATSAGRRLCEMVEEVLRQARVGAHLELADVDLDALVRVVVGDLDAVLQPLGGRVDVGDLGHVRADEHQLYVVLLNLVGNAVKFHRPGTAPRVTVRREDLDGRTRIIVTDDGIGVPEDQREAVFREFARGTAGDGIRGEGIGLATVRRIVQAHGGTVHLEGTHGSGTAAVITLPCTPPLTGPES